ncbi:peptidase S8/S53 domain-containing protein [Cladochytrium replicatum]|nr:peptidase S8/S53 domain-containing protein [Cladochytrium replicatum]
MLPQSKVLQRRIFILFDCGHVRLPLTAQLNYPVDLQTTYTTPAGSSPASVPAPPTSLPQNGPSSTPPQTPPPPTPTQPPNPSSPPAHSHFIPVHNWREIVRTHRDWIQSRIASYSSNHLSRRATESAEMRWWYDGGESGMYQAYALRAPAGLVSEIKARGDVEFIAEDGEVGLERVQLDAEPSLRRLSSSGEQLADRYAFPDSGGVNAIVYVIDSGVEERTTKSEFQRTGFKPGVSRLLTDLGKSFVSGQPGLNPHEDLRGHGTHVAGIIASTTFGVAKNASIISYRVFGKSESTFVSDIIAALNDAAASCRAFNSTRPCIVNMSLSASAGKPVDPLRNAVEFATSPDGNLFVAVAAGNQGADACTRSPSGANGAAVTVGAVGADRTVPGYSNFGPCVNMWAVGNDVTSLAADEVGGSRVATGTSMSSPQVAGLAALIVSEHVQITPLDVKDAIVESAHRGLVLGDVKGAPNFLAFNGGEVII